MSRAPPAPAVIRRPLTSLSSPILVSVSVQSTRRHKPGSGETRGTTRSRDLRPDPTAGVTTRTGRTFGRRDSTGLVQRRRALDFFGYHLHGTPRVLRGAQLATPVPTWAPTSVKVSGLVPAAAFGSGSYRPRLFICVARPPVPPGVSPVQSCVWCPTASSTHPSCLLLCRSYRRGVVNGTDTSRSRRGFPQGTGASGQGLGLWSKSRDEVPVLPYALRRRPKGSSFVPETPVFSTGCRGVSGSSSSEVP